MKKPIWLSDKLYAHNTDGHLFHDQVRQADSSLQATLCNFLQKSTSMRVDFSTLDEVC